MTTRVGDCNESGVRTITLSCASGGRRELAHDRVAVSTGLRLPLHRAAYRIEALLILFRIEDLMRIHVGCELRFEFPQTTPMIVTLDVHFSRVSDLERQIIGY